MSIPVIKPTLEELNKCIARFKDLERCDAGIPDMQLPECKRTFMNVLGFSGTVKSGAESSSPFGDQAKPAISHLPAGFGISFIAVRPGKGVLMHTHDTVETFMVMKGRWKMEWEGNKGTEHVVLGPLDFIAIPIGVHRRFECVKAAEGSTEGLLLGIIAGDAPYAEASPGAMERMYESGLMKREAATA